MPEETPYQSKSCLPKPDPDVMEILRGSISYMKQLHESEPEEIGLCNVCKDNNAMIGYSIEPCGHNTVCISCLNNLQELICPYCHLGITWVSRTKCRLTVKA